MKTCLLAFSLLLIVSVTNAQPAKNRVISIPVERNGIQLRYPWTGGMDSPQFSRADLNGDGLEDLFVFDRTGDKVLVYLRQPAVDDDTAYVYAPQYEELFPAELNNYALLRDYNHDGIPDIFTHVGLGTQVFKGTLVNDVLHFNLVCPLMQYKYSPALNTNIWSNIDDVPAFVDVNGDGDIDVLTYGTFGAFVEYYENQTVEHAGDPSYDVDSFKFENQTLCWGNFQESASSNAITLNVNCKGDGNSAQPTDGGARHAGATLYSFDADHDHDVDLLIGNISYNTVAFAHNCGDSSYANVCNTDSTFPSCGTPINMEFFAGCYGVDVDNDGYEDLLVAPNARSASRNINNVMYYHNGHNGTCDYEYENDSFLVHHSMDFGTDSKPVFFDFNGDGLQDIVVGNYGYFRPFSTYKSTLAFYENIGTSTHPAYRQRTDDYNNFSSLGLAAIHPAFGDLDGDGKQDLVIGESNGKIYYSKNTGGTVAAFSPAVTQLVDTDVGSYSAPFIYDVNGDSLPDLLVGKKNGKISYYWNLGTRTNPYFNPDSVNEFFGEVYVNLPGYSEGYSCPFMESDSGRLLLFSGSSRGTIFEYQVNPNNLRGGPFTLLDSNFLKHDVGSKSTISIADINNDHKMEYLVGNSRGGIMMYSDIVWDSTAQPLTIAPNTLTPGYKVYPNPANNNFTLAIDEGQWNRPVIEIYNLFRQRITALTQVEGRQILFNTTDMPAGLYLVRVTDGSKKYFAKVLIER